MFDPKTFSFDVEKMTEFFKQNDFTKHLATLKVPGMDAEAPSILLRDALLFFRNKKFREVALEEPRKYSSTYFFNNARKLVKELSPSDIESCPKAGIRPQLVDVEKNELVMDFVIEGTQESVHVLNSISPAFTSSLFFSEMLCNEHLIPRLRRL